jgi:hypothetical protein
VTHPRNHHPPQPEKQAIRLTPQQLGTLLVLDGLVVALQTGANQLGGFLGLKAEGNLVLQALEVLVKGRDGLRAEWAKAVQLAPASALSALEEKTS